MRNIIRLLLLIATVSIIPAKLPAVSLSEQTLQADINYYRKTATAENLSANDRKYILNRIRAKYASSNVNTSKLDQEIANVSKPVQLPVQETAAEQKAKPARLPQHSIKQTNAVKKLLVSENPLNSVITVTADGVERSNYFLLQDPDPAIPPKIVLDLYGVSDSLSKAARDIRPKNGIFARVHTGQFSKDPLIVRVVADLRKDSAYRVRNTDGQWFIEVEKDTPEPQKNLEKLSVPISSEPLTTTQLTRTETAKPKQDLPADTGDKLSTSDLKNYKIESGDVISIAVIPAEELSREVIVQPDGTVPFPLIGSAQAKALSPQELQDSLEVKLGRFITNPKVTISVRQFSRRQVFITGEVHSVGSYNFKENMRLLEFISSVGGFTNNADRAHVKVYRGPATKRQTHTVNLDELIKSGDFTKDFLLEPADIIEVSKGQARVAVLGDVRSPGYYDYKENMKLVELISLAGGYTDSAKITEISVIVNDETNASATSNKVMKVNLEKILSGSQKDVAIASGDTVYLPKKGLASAGWFITNVLPWMSLLSIILVLRLGI